MISQPDFWNRAAGKYANSPIKNMPAYEKTLARVRAHVVSTDNALELGCGTGTTALKLADALNHITATDISGNMIEIARSKAREQGADSVNFQVAQPGDGSLQGQYDVVMAFNFLHLMADLPRVLAEIHDLVKPGGIFISKSTCMSGPYRLLWLLIAVMRLIGKAPYVNFFSTARLEQQIEASGFEILETGDYPESSPNHFVVARKR